MPQKKHIRVVCAIIMNGDKVLIARRGPDQSHAGSWEFPGGKINPDEKPVEALVRELREELAVTVSIQYALSPVSHVYESLSVELIPYVCIIEEGAITPVDHDEIRWIDRTKVMEVPLLPPDRVIGEEFLQKNSGYSNENPLEK